MACMLWILAVLYLALPDEALAANISHKKLSSLVYDTIQHRLHVRFMALNIHSLR